jgi:glycosyltransferase involved in cell wall biosynthesis
LFYKGLSESESSIFKKTFFKQESKKLAKYESILKKVDGIFTISPYEQAYFLEKFGKKSIYVPAFHEITKDINYVIDSEKTVFFHGNILVPENIKAILFLIDVYKDSIYNLVIASSHQNKNINTEINKHKNIRFVDLNSQEDLKQLFRTAHINVLPTFQKTGIKLKLLNALYQGKFIIANNDMVEDTGLEELTEIANSKEEFLQKTAILFNKEFDQEIVNKRLKILENFSPEKSAQRIVDTIFN